MGSLDKSLFILKRLGDPPYEFSLAELASFSGIGKSGAFKILKTLQKHNFVIQDFVTKKYHLSPIMIRLGNVYGRLKGIEENQAGSFIHFPYTWRDHVYHRLGR